MCFGEAGQVEGESSQMWPGLWGRGCRIRRGGLVPGATPWLSPGLQWSVCPAPLQLAFFLC